MSLQGMGVVMASEAPCPMESDMEAMVIAGELSIEDLPDCCNDMQTWAETGHLFPWHRSGDVELGPGFSSGAHPLERAARHALAPTHRQLIEPRAVGVRP